jgi:hypothetical protein
MMKRQSGPATLVVFLKGRDVREVAYIRGIIKAIGVEDENAVTTCEQVMSRDYRMVISGFGDKGMEIDEKSGPEVIEIEDIEGDNPDNSLVIYIKAWESRTSTFVNGTLLMLQHALLQASVACLMVALFRFYLHIAIEYDPLAHVRDRYDWDLEWVANYIVYSICSSFMMVSLRYSYRKLTV